MSCAPATGSTGFAGAAGAGIGVGVAGWALPPTLNVTRRPRPWGRSRANRRGCLPCLAWWWALGAGAMVGGTTVGAGVGGVKLWVVGAAAGAGAAGVVFEVV